MAAITWHAFLQKLILAGLKILTGVPSESRELGRVAFCRGNAKADPSHSDFNSGASPPWGDLWALQDSCAPPCAG